MRKDLLKEIVQNPEGEVWCISKHLLAASMRLMEVGTKKLSDGRQEEAEGLFHKSYDLWNIFWGLNLGLLEVKDLKKTEEDSKEAETLTVQSKNKEKHLSVLLN